MTCPHCWPPEAVARAAEKAARVAHEVAQAHAAWEARALLARLLAGPTDAERGLTDNRPLIDNGEAP